jgi:hypothetical protein
VSHLILPIAFILLTMSVYSLNSRRARRTLERVRKGQPTTIPVKVASKSGPYPRKLVAAKLTRTADGGAAFVDIANTERVILLDAPGLTLTRATQEFDGASRLQPGGTQLGFKCVDPHGNRVDVAVRESYIGAVASLLDPQCPTPPTDVSQVARVKGTDTTHLKAGRFSMTPALWVTLCIPVVLAAFFVVLALFSQPVIATVTRNNNDGSCNVTYKSAYSGQPTSDTVDCPKSAVIGDKLTVDQVAGLGAGNLESAAGLFSYLVFIVLVCALFSTPFFVVLWLNARVRKAGRHADGTRPRRLTRITADPSVESVAPQRVSVADPGPLIYSTISERVRDRAQAEDWHNERGRDQRKLPPLRRLIEWNPPWGLALMRTASVWIAVIFTVVLPLIIAVPDFIDLRSVQRQQTLVTTATVEPNSCGSIFFLVPPTFTAKFTAAGTATSTQLTTKTCPTTKTVQIEYVIDDPAHALLVEGDASAQVVIAATLILILGGLYIGRRISRSVGPARRFSTLVAKRTTTRPYRYVITRTPDENDVMMLFLPLGDEPPRWGVRLIARASDRIPSDGYVDVIEGETRKGQRDLVPVYNKETLWPTGPSAPGEWLDVAFLIDPSSRLATLVRQSLADQTAPPVGPPVIGPPHPPNESSTDESRNIPPSDEQPPPA